MFKILSSLTLRWNSLIKKTLTLNSRYFYKQVTVLADVEHKWLLELGIEGVILDLDNTVISEDDRYFSPHAESWIEAAKLLDFKLFVLSNGHRRHRAIHWAGYLDLPLINPARKPFPFSFYRAMNRMQLTGDRVVVIGDSLHTDVIGAWLSGCHCIQVASLPHPPRWWENLVGKWVQIPYPSNRGLWTVHSNK